MLTGKGVPPHALHLKEGAICLLMRNMSIEKGLVKNARVIVHRLHSRTIQIRVINNQTGQLGDTYFLPRIRFDFSPPHVTWTIQRLQFPLKLAYATTFHSCLGLTLDKTVLDLRTDVFTHGQLYTAISRVRSRQDTRLLLSQTNMTGHVRNVVYKQLIS